MTNVWSGSDPIATGPAPVVGNAWTDRYVVDWTAESNHDFRTGGDGTYVDSAGVSWDPTGFTLRDLPTTHDILSGTGWRFIFTTTASTYCWVPQLFKQAGVVADWDPDVDDVWWLEKITVAGMLTNFEAAFLFLSNGAATRTFGAAVQHNSTPYVPQWTRDALTGVFADLGAWPRWLSVRKHGETAWLYYSLSETEPTKPSDMTLMGTNEGTVAHDKPGSTASDWVAATDEFKFIVGHPKGAGFSVIREKTIIRTLAAA